MSAAMNRRGFSVRVFLPDGDPDGVKVIEKSNWTGCGLVIPRALFGEAKLRPEVNRTGVYLLVGPSESSALPQAYIGEGDPVRPRLEQHAKQKDFWTHAVIFTSKDQNLNKAHVQRLESRLVELAKASKRCMLENANQPQPPRSLRPIPQKSMASWMICSCAYPSSGMGSSRWRRRRKATRCSCF